MRKLIHSKFELDLSRFKVSDTEENNWFSDSFFTKYSFPFDIDLTDDIDIALGFISQYNAENVTTYFDLLYVHNNKIEYAVLEIESHEERLSCTLRFGMEQLPSFDKLLSELSLDKITLPVGTTIYQHAQTIIGQTFPAVNYNFPQIHVDKYDPEDELWNGFEKILNNRVNGVFLENTVENDITYNRNVIQPLPSLIHILQRGMIDAGYVLSGEILSDERLKDVYLYADIDYFKKTEPLESIPVMVLASEATSTGTIQLEGEFRLTTDHNPNHDIIVNDPIGYWALYQSTTTLVEPGKYNINGDILLMVSSWLHLYIKIKYKNTVLYLIDYPQGNGWFMRFGDDKKELTYNIDLNFETNNDGAPHDVTVEVYCKQNFTGDEKTIIDLSIDNVVLFDTSGANVSNVQNLPIVDLQKAVPEITFGDCVKVIKNWFNYDLTIVDNFAVMNTVEFQMNYTNAISLEKKEVKYPFRKFSQGNSFLLKFQDVESKDYKFLPVFQNNLGYVTKNFKTDDKTTTIEINGLPLPYLHRNGVQTAHAFESDSAKVYLVKYTGIYAGNNYTHPSTDYEIPSVHLRYWRKWFETRIFAQGFRWQFKSWQEDIKDLKVKSKIYAYKRFHIIKTLNKTEEKPELFTVEITTETLK